jgi:hypothetical protein
MAEEVATAPALSRNILGMKFMQRTKLALESEAKAGKSGSDRWVTGNTAVKAPRIQVEEVTSFSQVEPLLPLGRMSFRKFNSEVETLESVSKTGLEDQQRTDAIQEIKDKQSSSDRELAAR